MISPHGSIASFVMFRYLKFGYVLIVLSVWQFLKVFPESIVIDKLMVNVVNEEHDEKALYPFSFVYDSKSIRDYAFTGGEILNFQLK